MNTRFKTELDRVHRDLFGESYTDGGDTDFLDILATLTTEEAEACADSEDAEISYGDLETFERARDNLGLNI